ncbi:MAG: anthranilate synthase component I [bacterium]
MKKSDKAFAHYMPEFSEFEVKYRQGTAQIVWRKMIGDLETPVSAYLKLAQQDDNNFLLESVEGGETLGRYSVIGMSPDLIWRADGNKAFVTPLTPSGREADQEKLENATTLDSLRQLLQASEIKLEDSQRGLLPPMFAGVFGFLGYDTVRLTEDLLAPPANDLGVPDAIFIRPTILVVFDNVRQEIFFITPCRPDPILPALTAYQQAQERLDAAMDRLQQPMPTVPEVIDEKSALSFTSNIDENDFRNMVERAKDYIAAGDIFQVVLSQRFTSDYAAPPFALYRALRRLNPSPFMFYLNFAGFSLCGSSPEILVRVRDDEITIRPIAGTRPRGDTQIEDKRLEQDLLADPKERAEHLMLLDLGRNDVGRCAQIGTVDVTSQFQIERYSHVMHIVSNVTGQLDQTRFDGVDALFAGFPAGTVSGAPKISAMDIISQLEPDARGPYGGCIGYFSADGEIDTCIALRTALIKDGKIHIQAGAGIVADSDANAENQECHNKARAIMDAARFSYGQGNG